MDEIDLVSEGKLKRLFRSRRKLNAAGLVSHITQRSAGREPMFVEDDDFLYMMGLLKEAAGTYSLNIFAVCLMPNHMHFLMSPDKENLYDAMRDLFSQYVLRFNRKYERKGHLVGAPYRQAICFDDGYLLAASLYIHMNPVKAGLAETVSDYRWTSSRLYCDPDAPESFVDPSFVLRILSEDASAAKETYRMLLGNAGGLNVGHILEQEDAIEGFRKKLVSMFPRLFAMVSKDNRTAARTGKDLLSWDAIEERIRAVRSGEAESTPRSRAARKYLIEQMLARGFTKTEIASQLGISRRTVYNLLELPS